MKFPRTNRILDRGTDALVDADKMVLLTKLVARENEDKDENKTFLDKLINAIARVSKEYCDWVNAKDENCREQELKFWRDMKYKLLELVEEDFQMKKKYPGEYEEAKRIVRNLSENTENNEKTEKEEVLKIANEILDWMSEDEREKEMKLFRREIEMIEQKYNGKQMTNKIYSVDRKNKFNEKIICNDCEVSGDAVKNVAMNDVENKGKATICEKEDEVFEKIKLMLMRVLPKTAKIYKNVLLNGQLFQLIVVCEDCGVIFVRKCLSGVEFCNRSGGEIDIKERAKITYSRLLKCFPVQEENNLKNGNAILRIRGRLNILIDFDRELCAPEFIFDDLTVIFGENFGDKEENIIREFVRLSNRNLFSREIDEAIHSILPWVDRGSIESVEKTKGDCVFNHLNDKQRRAVYESTKKLFRKIKGCPGSGKSIVLAARGGVLLEQGKKVLFVTYNITAAIYLRELVEKYFYEKRGDGLIGKMTCLNIHQLASEYVKKYNLDAEIEHWFDRLVAIFNKNQLEEQEKFDAIIIDEGQDFEESWIKFLKYFLLPDGEMLFAKDAAQNIYDRKDWTDEVLSKLGFSRTWFNLENGYRFPPDYADLLQKFAEKYLKLDDDWSIKCVQSELALQKTQQKWVQVNSSARDVLVATVFDELEIYAKKGGDINDLVILVQTNDIGRLIENKLTEKDIDVFSVIGNRDNKTKYSSRKRTLKLFTIKSYKGISAKKILLVINSSKHRNDKEVFVGLSRLGGNDVDDCSITVVCNDANYLNYGKKWNVFEERSSDVVDTNEKSLKFNNFIEIKEDFKNWLLKSSGVDPGEIYYHDFNVYDNKFNSKSDNYLYLNRYFFQTFNFIKQFWGNILRKKDVFERLLNGKVLNILSVGTGTGADVVGVLDVLLELGFDGELKISIIDANESALSIAENIISNFVKDYRCGFSVALDSSICDFEKGFNVNLEYNSYDIIMTSKMFNEIIARKHTGAPIFEFLVDIVSRYSNKYTLTMIADVPIYRDINWRYGKGFLNNMVEEDNSEIYRKYINNCSEFFFQRRAWVPCVIYSQIKKYLTREEGKEVIVPIPCSYLCGNMCYTTNMYSYRIGDGDIVTNPITIFLLSDKNAYPELEMFDKNEWYVTTSNKNGMVTVCRLNDKSCCKKKIWAFEAENINAKSAYFGG